MSVHFTFAPTPVFLPAQGVKHIHTPMTMSVRFTSATTSLFFTCTRSKTHTRTNGLSFHFCPYIYFLPAHGGVEHTHTHTHTNVCSFHFCLYNCFLPAQGGIKHTHTPMSVHFSPAPPSIFTSTRRSKTHTHANVCSFLSCPSIYFYQHKESNIHKSTHLALIQRTVLTNASGTKMHKASTLSASNEISTAWRLGAKTDGA